MLSGFIVVCYLWHVQKELPPGQKKRHFLDQANCVSLFPNYGDCMLFFILYFDN